MGDFRGGSGTGVRAGLVHEGDIFEARDEDAAKLEARGWAIICREPVLATIPMPAAQAQTFKSLDGAYENKAIAPDENKEPLASPSTFRVSGAGSIHTALQRKPKRARFGR